MTQRPIHRPAPRRGHRATAGLATASLAPLLLAASVLSVTAAGCSRAPQRGEHAPRIDRPMMACLGALRAYHRQADVHLASGDPRAAIASIERILALRCIDRPNPEIQEAVLDAYGRLARLHLKLGETREAAKRVREGLHRGGPPSFFRANLLMVQGDVLDAQAQALDKAGTPGDAKSLRRRAIDAFERSARMNKRLLEELVR